MQQSPSLQIVGHRGAHGLAPDNSLAGMDQALRFGVDQIEVDLRPSADGVVVLSHDEQLKDATGKELRVATTPYEDLKAHFPDLLTLDELITHINRRAKLMLEIKDHAATPATIATVKRYLAKGWQPADFSIASFKYAPLALCKTELPGIDLVVIDGWSGVRATSRARRLGTEYISMNQAYLWSGFIRSVARRYKLFCYYSDESFRPLRQRQPDGWEAYGLHGIITDYPNHYSSAIVEDNESNLRSQRRTHPEHQDVLV
jgi:glycerophosphoryl diester phosphodiesterase